MCSPALADGETLEKESKCVSEHKVPQITPLVSILIVTWNRRDEVGRSIESALGQTYPNVEIVVIDNHSQDGTAEFIARAYPSVRLIRAHRNLGCPTGRNLGFSNCRGQYIFSLDDDGWLQEDALEISVRSAMADPKTAVIMSRIREQDQTGEVHCLPEGLDSPVYLGHFIGCCFLIRKAALDEVGGFQEDYFRQSEEEELALRLMDAGWTVKFEPDSVMNHAPSPSGRNLNTFLYYQLCNTLKTGLRTWPFPWNLLRAISIARRAVWLGIVRRLPLLPLRILWCLLSEPWKSLRLRKPVRRKAFLAHRRLTMTPSADPPDLS